MLYLSRILFVLLTLRLLMPPGICVCKLSSPASRLIVAFLQTGKLVPIEQHDDRDDDHDPGCPCSYLAPGMGVAPPTEPFLPPILSFELVDTLDLEGTVSSPLAALVRPHDLAPDDPLYLTLCALQI